MIAGVSSCLWNLKGVRSFHSKEEGMCPEEITPRWAAKASHRRKIKKSSATKEIIEPTLDTTFHLVYASG